MRCQPNRKCENVKTKPNVKESESGRNRIESSRTGLFSLVEHFQLDSSSLTWFLLAQAHDPKLTAPGGSSIASWLAEDFRVGSEQGHTVIFPHQTDACPICSSLKVDIDSVEMSIKRHEQQKDDMTLERVATIKELTQQVEELRDEFRSHKAEAGDAQARYKARIERARDAYLEVQLAYTRFAMAKQAVQVSGQGDFSSELEEVIRLAAQFVYALDSDYQQDKMTPFWGKSPQPGPTYFFSKETNYVHIIIQHALGDKAGPTRIPRCQYYIRTQECAGSKDCNDTVFTIFDMLACPHPPTCTQPQLYRTGYDKEGRVLAPAEVTGAAEAPAEDEGAGKDEGDGEPAGAAASAALRAELVSHVRSRLPSSSLEWDASVHADFTVMAACEATLDAARHVACERLQAALRGSSSAEQPPAAITELDILKATRPHGKVEANAAAADAIVNSIGLESLGLVVLAYLSASSPQKVIRWTSLQMDRCAGTNISQFTFGAQYVIIRILVL